jgi:hypothetical protein
MTSPVFELKRTIEFDFQLGDDYFPMRVEVFQDIANPNQFRCRIWKLEFYRLQPSFPQDNDGEPSDFSADEQVWFDWGHNLSNDYQLFTAKDSDDALAKILADVKQFLIRVTGVD